MKLNKEKLSIEDIEKLMDNHNIKVEILPNGEIHIIRKEEKEKPKDFPKIVCLCGSTRFMEQFFSVGWDFTLKGYIVLSVGVCKCADKDGAHGAEALGQDVVYKLDELHLRKIDLADEVYVLNKNGYIGKPTSKEISYAREQGKPISYLEPDNLPCANS